MNELLDAAKLYGTGQKKLSLYLIGIVLCIILTLVPFITVMSHKLSHDVVLVIVYAAALGQFLVQVFFFLRLNTKTEQGVINVMSFLFSILILVVLIGGSLWIMWHLNYNMMH